MINEILKYPDDCAGSIMTTEYVSLRPNMTAGEAIQRIRCTGVDKETIYTCYVTENNRKLVGMCPYGPSCSARTRMCWRTSWRAM